MPEPSTIVFYFGRPLTPVCFHSSQPAKTSHCLYAPDLLHKPILTACPCLNRPTHASVLSGYTDSIVDKVLILPPRQVHQESEPSKGVKFLESFITAIIDPRHEWSITFLSQFSNFAKPAFDWLEKSAKLASNWLEKKARMVSYSRIHMTNIKIL